MGNLASLHLKSFSKANFRKSTNSLGKNILTMRPVFQDFTLLKMNKRSAKINFASREQ